MKFSSFFLPFFAVNVEAYPSGAPSYISVLESLRPGGPHSNSYARRAQYGPALHGITLNVQKTGHHSAKVILNF